MTENSAAELRLLKIAYENKPSLWARTYNNRRACVVIVDMVDGFCNEGALYSPRFARLAEVQAAALDYLGDSYKVFLNDTHTGNSAEFKYFPPHCHTRAEIGVTKALVHYINKIVPKNSTNGVFAFLKSVDVSKYDNFLIMGVCTDICVLQFSLSLRAYFNEQDAVPNIIVFTDYTDTYDADGHSAELYNTVSYKLMEDSGVQIFKNLK